MSRLFIPQTIIRYKCVRHAAYLRLAGVLKYRDAVQKLETSGNLVGVRGQPLSGNTRKRAAVSAARIWYRPPARLTSLRDDGLKLIAKLPESQQLSIYWGMAMATSPFWTAVATYAGRLLRLTGQAFSHAVIRRLHEQYGERDTVTLGARNVLNSFVDWGVLERGSIRGQFLPGKTVQIEDPEVFAWMIRAFAYAHQKDFVDYNLIQSTPVFFPLQLPVMTAAQVAAVSGFNYHYYDFDQVLLEVA